MPDAKAEVVPIVRTEAVEGFQGVSVSREGKWIAYTSDVTGRTEVWVRPYPGPGAPLPVSANGGAEPQWSRDGRELYFIGDRDTIMMAAINPGPQLSFKPPVTLFQTSFMRAGQPPSYDVAPDGRFVLVRRGESQSAETNLIVEVNWLEELKRRVPIK
jgi:serine/threonine-protein kinase